MRKLKQVYLNLIITAAVMLCTVSSCGVKYSFTGGSIPADMKTVNVQFFENIAPMVYATLSQNFTEALKTRFRNQTRLSQVNTGGDAIFEGFITNYTITPAAVEARTDMAALNRLTITVKVTYTNQKKPEDSFSEQIFTRFKDFSGTVQAQEEGLTKDIIEMLTEDIYNRAFANW
ncbi:LptE family protein [Sphingobacterium spiritivorum]|uniref:LptE family protein n=1 Tax=Sphingobacterium spiritivorum TaxID=258 RepID=UPI00191A1491|nr:LptE family protein [Sphingobacterium spiritivorum]QQT27904.1 LptE family protein [Sphingobacterium spiritivorum]